MLAKRSLLVVLGAAVVAAGASAGTAKPRPAADLHVTAAVVPTANRLGGTFISGAEIRNVGRRAAVGVVVTVEVAGELVFAPEPAASCERGAANYVCRLGTLRPGARVSLDFRTRATALGVLVLRARATSRTRDARPRDNAARASARVTEPDSVRGTGVRPTAGGGPRPPVTIQVDAISGPAGDDAAGTFWTKYPAGFELRGRVVCLTVNGRRASVGGVVEETTLPMTNPVGSTVHLGITDNGPPEAGPDLEVTYLQMQDASSCPVPLQDFPEIPLISGDFTVQDEM